MYKHIDIIDCDDNIGTTTKNSYKNAIKYLLKKIPHDTVVELLDDYNTVLDYISTNIVDPKSKNQYLSALLKYSVHHHTGDQCKITGVYREHFNLNRKQIKTSRNKNNRERTSCDISTNEDDNWNTVLECFGKLKEKYSDILETDDTYVLAEHYEDVMNYVLFACYVLHAPRRSKDYTCMTIGQVDPKINYIDIPNRCFCFREYKTGKHYGEEIVPLNDELCSIIQCFIHRYRKKGIYLFSEQLSANEPITEKYVVKTLSMIGHRYGININIRKLRHLYITHLFKDEMQPSVIKNIERSLGTSISMITNVYRDEK
ncbi:hypothetical protein [Heterosigma akashiwo virus 01]|uniref:Tyr recombinase domain-containing protein n=1 Tax=Heterosigma akashiwo virus 01 TaxID=97195 RepID=A0A1C9C504_HAV01|nr:hypothetical protein D1R72_gp035 [Heterosigma akashiwo virus 01]AOM63366.1 hypothetical protein [Heterosigma akashiwo virus 01]